MFSLQLMEMGFSLTRCIEALRHTQSLEQATDYLLQGNDFAAPGGQVSQSRLTVNNKNFNSLNRLIGENLNL